MLRILLILPLCLWLSMASAVNLDSLWGVWNDSTQPDTNRLKAIHDIAWYGYLFSQPDSAFYFAQLQYDLAKSGNNKKQMAKALNTQGAYFLSQSNYTESIEYYSRCLEIYEELEYKQGIAATLNNLGIAYKNLSDYANAIDCYTVSLKIREELGDIQAIGTVCLNLGVVFYRQNNYEKAFENWLMCLKINEELGNKKKLAKPLNNIGNIYSKQGDYPKAIDYYTRSLKIKEETGDKSGMAMSFNNIGGIYVLQGNYPVAMNHYIKSLKIREELGDKHGTAMTLENIGGIYNNQGDYPEATKYYTRSLTISEEIGNKHGIVTSLHDIGGIHYKQGFYIKALVKCNQALSIAQEIGTVEQIKNTSKSLWEINKKIGKHSQALEMHELYIEMRDSINSIESKEAVIKLEYQYKYEKEQALADAKHQEALSLSAEREKRQELIAWSAGGGLVMVLAFAFFIFNRLRVTQLQKKVIQEQKELVEEQKRDMTDSIRYAENIQQALLPTIDDLKNSLPDGFVLFQPKDIVSGDFYWLQEHNDKVYLAVCDCTGHGVPGAFMSMIGSSMLDEAVVEKGITQPNEIFYEVRKGFINALKQTKDAGSQKDGMDAALITWDKGSALQVAAAYNPVLLIRNGELNEIKPDKQPVGFLTGKQKEFTHHEVALEKGDTVYMFSDGYHDQFGGSKGKKYKLSKFKKLLLSLQGKTMNEQKSVLEETMRQWKGKEDQVDDILVMGVRF